MTETKQTMHVLIPTINCSQGKGTRCVELLEPMVKYSATEKDNNAYLFFTGVDSPDTVRGIELYNTRPALEEVHLQSDEFKTFAGSLGSEGVVSGPPVLDHYSPVHGFPSRSSSAASPTGTFIWLAELTCKDSASRDKVLELAEPLVKYVESNEPKTLSYYFLKSLDDDTKMTVFEQYVNKEALTEIHHKSEEFQDFGKKVREGGYVVDKTSTGYTTVIGHLSK